MFHKEIGAIKQHAEKQFVEALLRFHQRRLESHAKKIERAKYAKHRNKRFIISSRTESQSPSASIANNVNNDVNRIDNLEKQLFEMKEMICTHLLNNNKNVESYNSVVSEQTTTKTTSTRSVARLSKNGKRIRRRKTAKQIRYNKEREENEKFLKNLSDHRLTDSQVSVLSKGLRFIPTPVTNGNEIKRHLLADFEHFARRMRLQYIFHGNNKGKHPFHVKSNWVPPVQPSVALESYLENVKVGLAEITVQKPKYNLSRKEHTAVKELKQNTAINLKKADKGSTTVILNITDKLQEGLIQLNNRDHYLPLEKPMVAETLQKAKEIISQLHND